MVIFQYLHYRYFVTVATFGDVATTCPPLCGCILYAHSPLWILPHILCQYRTIQLSFQFNYTFQFHAIFEVRMSGLLSGEG